MKGISICADDYGLHPEVDRAIVDLARRKRLGATSVLVDAQGLSERAAWLDGTDIDVGLHLNLTQVVGDLDAADVQTSLARLILSCYLGRTSRQWVRNSVRRQLDRFESLFGRMPDYVDGHQHVHQLPIVREVLLQELSERFPRVSGESVDRTRARPWIRSTCASAGLLRTGFRQWVKAMVIQGLGAKSLEQSARAAGFSMNTGFAGIYDFTRPALPYDVLMRHWLDTCAQASVIMTHPSCATIKADPVGQARRVEYQMLCSDGFAKLLAERDLCIVRPSALLSGAPIAHQGSSTP